MKTLGARRALLPIILLAAGCGSSPNGDAKPDAGPGPYDHVPPPAAAVPAGLEAAVWVTHLEEDLLPFWRMPEAAGTPIGNFPTYRGMDGSVQGSALRKPRMMGRQVFTYPKANEWKNGFHAAEHALVMNLLGHYLEGTPATLYFALPADQLQALAAASAPYTFLGRVVQVEDLRPLASDPTRRVVRVSFDQLH